MRKQKNILFALLPLLFLGGSIAAQDMHLSQFYNAPLLINPGLTGNYEGVTRGYVNYRDQWTGASPFKTYAVSFDAGLLRKKMRPHHLGAGFFVYQDEAGDAQLSTTQLSFTLSSVIALDDNNFLSAGLLGGYGQRSMDAGSFRWGEQFDGTGYAPGMASTESPTFEPYSFGDFSAGIAWRYGIGKSNLSMNNTVQAHAGFAVYHINAPQQGYEKEFLHRNFVLHGHLDAGISHLPLHIVPSLLYMSQGPEKQLNLGWAFRYVMRDDAKYTGFLKKTAVSLGTYYRVGDALIPTFTFEFADYQLGVSYDFSFGGVSDINNGQGGLEISLRHINPVPKGKASAN
jgi:type IX secretion system PorP/SprF family membrane protein